MKEELLQALIPIPSDVPTALPSQSQIQTVAEVLSRPWTQGDLKQGRTLSTCKIGGSDNARQIVLMCSKAGWKVKLIHDQRDGDFLIFHKP